MRIDPSKFCTILRDRLAGLDPAAEEMQFHNFLGILMSYDLEGSGKIDTNVQLFPQLPMQTFLQRFARLSLAAGKLPKAPEMHPRLATRNEVAPLESNQSCRHLDNLHGAS